MSPPMHATIIATTTQPPADNGGAKERTHSIRVVLAHLGRNVLVIGIRSEENGGKRTDHPQGEQHVCGDVSRGTDVTATPGDEITQETEDQGNRNGHPRVPGHDHQEGNNSARDRERAEHTRTHQHQHDDRSVEQQSDDPTDEHERWPEEAQHPRAPHEDEVDGGKSTDRDGRACFCDAQPCSLRHFVTLYECRFIEAN